MAKSAEILAIEKADSNWRTAAQLHKDWGTRQLDGVYARISHLRRHKGVTIKEKANPKGGQKLYLVPSSVKAVQAAKAPAKKRKAKASPKRKVQKKPATELDKLIAAASAVGAENEILKKKLAAIRAILDD